MSQRMAGRTSLGLVAALLVVLSPIGQLPARARDYDVVLTGVKEVALVGSADRAFWEAQLAPEGLFPAIRQGRAEVVIAAMVSRYMGVRFREAVVSVATTAKPGGQERNGYFLVHGASSNPLFAWVERSMNRSPYAHGNVRPVFEPSRIGLTWDEGGKRILQALMTAPAMASGTERDTFEGPIYLPRALSPEAKGGSYFAAKLDGETAVYPFDVHRDTFRLGAGNQDVVRVLRDSHFTPDTWRIRQQATHAKTNTLQR